MQPTRYLHLGGFEFPFQLKKERGLDSTMGRASSSRRPADAHWASALRWVRVPRLTKKRDTLKGVSFFGASVLIGLFEKSCHTNGFSDFRVANFLVFTSQSNTKIISIE